MGSQPGKQKLLVIDDEGKLQKRSILGTPDIYKQVQNKIRDVSKAAKKQQTVVSHMSHQNIGILKSAISTPKGRLIRNQKVSLHNQDNNTSHNSQQQQKGVNFQSKPQQAAKVISDQYIDRMFKDISEQIQENDREELKQQELLPLSIQLQQSKSQRIFQKYEQAKDYWDKKKFTLAMQSQKPFVEQSVMHSTSEYRKKIETQELIDKAKLNIETMGSTLWRANLRNYYLNNTNLRLQGTYQKPKSKTEEQVKKLALKEQNLLEQRESQKTFLHLDSLGQSVDMACVYLDKSYKPTEVIRTPNFEQVKINNDLMGSYMFDQKLGETHQFNQTIKSNNDQQQDPAYESQIQWINDNFKQQVIPEVEVEDEDNFLYKTTDSMKSIMAIRESVDQQVSQFQKNKRSSLRIEDLDNDQTIHADNKNLRASRLSYNQSQTSHVSKRKQHTLDQFEKTTEMIRSTHKHLICSTKDEDIASLCLIGNNKLQLEYAAAKRIQGQKVLISKEQINNGNDDEEEENTQSDKEEVIAIDYDQKLFY